MPGWKWLTAVVLMGVVCSSEPAEATCKVNRDAFGNIVRSHAAVKAFRRSHPCPATGRLSGLCPGYVVDHVKPLCACGADTPANMQWQTVAAARVKDRAERRMCGKRV